MFALMVVDKMVALEVLRHFNADRKQIASEKTRHNDGFTKRTPIYLDLLQIILTTKPVYLLTSQQSASDRYDGFKLNGINSL
jgi:hypothetical protein